MLVLFASTSFAAGPGGGHYGGTIDPDGVYGGTIDPDGARIVVEVDPNG